MARPITKSRVQAGLTNGLIHVGADPNQMENVVCFIGSDGYWFYFRNGAGSEDFRTPEQYLAQTPINQIANLIYKTLTAFSGDPAFDDEVAYYDAILSEHGI